MKISLRSINRIAIFCLIGLRPLLGPASCRFSPSCGNYAIQQLETQPLWKACYRIIKRLLSCNPFFSKPL